MPWLSYQAFSSAKIQDEKPFHPSNPQTAAIQLQLNFIDALK